MADMDYGFPPLAERHGGNQFQTGHYLSDGPLPFGKLVLGAAQYGEFVCSKQTATWLRGGAMTHLDGKPVTLQVKDECRGGHNVVLGIWTENNR